MFKKKKNEEVAPNVNELIKALQAQLLTVDTSSEQYPKLVEQLDKLYKIRGYEKPDKFSKDTMLAVGGNIVGIVLILSYEQVSVISSKAFGLLVKPRV